MKKVCLPEWPPCDFCKEPAKYDVKTIHGPWAYVCQKCLGIHSNPSISSYGYELVAEKGDSPQ